MKVTKSFAVTGTLSNKMSTTDLLKLQKELEERERVLAERAKQ